jgi:FtsH-binding integral membrane protein
MSLAMAGAAFRAARGLASPAHRDGRRIARVVMWASAGEGIAIVAAVNALNWVGLPDYAICALAVIVGLHFVPLARGIPNARFYNITAVALVALGVAGCVIPPAQRGLVVGTVAAMILWATCLGVIATLRTERRPLAYAA